MTSRERVKRAIRFQSPDRIPVDLPGEWGTDFLTAGIEDDPGWKPRIKTELVWEDEWGCVWEKLPGDKTMGQVKRHPLEDYSRMETHRFPDYRNPERYVPTEKAVRNNKDEKFVLTGFPFSLIHRLEYLRGHEAAWTDPYLYPSELRRLLERLSGIAIDSLDRLSEIGVDGVISCDDWGLQDRLMVDPDIWREFWKPCYRKVYSHAREKGILTFLHSCGYITDILGDFIEAGLDVIQMDQQENMGIERLGRLFGGRITFWCPVDIQKTMIYGDVEDVRRYARRLMDSLGRFNGGFIAKWYPAPQAVNHDEEKIRAMCETFVTYGGSLYQASGKHC